MRTVLYGAALLLAGSIAASTQIRLQPATRPAVTAEHEDWFQLREPISFSGSVYYPAGARTYFDGNVMVQVGSYRGIPIYMNSTIEPFSIVLIPVGGGLMQPYERRRSGELAGTTGSGAPSFPVTQSTATAGAGFGGGRTGPVTSLGPPVVAPAIDRAQPATPAIAPEVEAILRDLPGAPAPAPTPAPPPPIAPPGSSSSSASGSAGTTGSTASTAPTPIPDSQGIWILFDGHRWRAGGRAVPFSTEGFRQVGEYRGVAVYAVATEPLPLVIYLPGRDGRMVAPYRRVDPEP
jgi:hypothetical protein